MHAFLIISSAADEIQKEITARQRSWNISSWDVVLFPEEGTVGIELVRDFQRELTLAPRNSPAKMGLVTNMERLTPEAQNAMLKTLEEPPPNTYIVGTTSLPEALLATVRSRMRTVKLTGEAVKIDPVYEDLVEKIISASPGRRLSLVEPYVTTRDDAKSFVASMISAARLQLLGHPSPKLVAFTRNLLAAQSQLSVNVNPKLVIDGVVLSIV